MKKIIIALLLLLPFSAVASDTSKSWNMSELLASLKTLSEGKQSQRHFTETRQTRLLKKPMVSEGTLTFIPPATFVKTIKTPGEEEATIAGNIVTLKKREEHGYRIDRIALDGHPALEGTLGSFVHLMRGEKAALEKLFTTETSGSEEAWELTLTPRSQEMLEYIQEIRVEGGKGDLSTITYEETNGNQITLQLGAIEQ
jgi:outer membrane lipoprotein-sorting protein